MPTIIHKYQRNHIIKTFQNFRTIKYLDTSTTQNRTDHIQTCKNIILSK